MPATISKKVIPLKIVNKVLVIVLMVAFTFGLAREVNAVTTVGLGTADSFAVLAGAGITNTGPTTINGDVGTFPTTTETGFGSVTLTGTNHAGDSTTQGAKTDLTTAYNDAAGRSHTNVPTELGGTTKTAGVYKSDISGTFQITGALTLDGQGNADSVFIFQADSTLITASSSSVVLINGAQACNVFWQVGSSATLGTSTTFTGTILALTTITLNTSATVEGRVLARNGAVTLDSNTITKPTCVTPPAAPAVSGSSTPPLINVTKIPTPLALPNGSGSVTYNYVVTNPGVVAMSNVSVTDNKCSPVTFISGNSNGSSTLDPGESWKYSCTTTLKQTTTNTVTATGEGNGIYVTDTANATVVVGLGSPAPLIHLVKKPSVFTLPTGGGPVTYTYTVTNPGIAPLNNVSVIDNRCTGLPGRVSGSVGGDTNKNNLLENTETWTFTCQSDLTKTTTNTGTAQGHANGLTAIDFSLATVVVGGIPGLPNTGLPPHGNNIPWYIPASIFLLSSVLLKLTYGRSKSHP